MNWSIIEDIIRIICLSASIISALIVLICSIKSGNTTSLKKILKWFEESYADGKITPEELAEGLKIIKELSNLTDK